MYQLTCPSCSQSMQTPFVRVSAVAVCPGCKHRWQVKEAHFRKLVEAPQQPTDPLLAPAPKSAGRAGRRFNEPLADLNTLAKVLDGSSTPGTPVTMAPADVPGEAMSNLMRWRRIKAMLSILALLALGGLLVVGGVMFERHSTTKPDAQAIGADPTSANELIAAPSQPQLPVRRIELEAVPMSVMPWQLVDEPLEPRQQNETNHIENERYVLRPATEEVVYQARVVTSEHGACADVTVHLAIVDENHRVLARMQVPIGLLSQRTPRMLEVPLSKALYERMKYMDWQIHVGRRMPVTLFIDSEDLRLERYRAGLETAVRVTAYNRTVNPLRNMVFIISAINVDEKVVAQWRVNVSETLEAGEGIEFAVHTPVDNALQVRQWHVEAAGEPVAAMFTPAKP